MSATAIKNGAINENNKKGRSIGNIGHNLLQKLTQIHNDDDLFNVVITAFASKV